MTWGKGKVSSSKKSQQACCCCGHRARAREQSPEGRAHRALALGLSAATGSSLLWNSAHLCSGSGVLSLPDSERAGSCHLWLLETFP